MAPRTPSLPDGAENVGSVDPMAGDPLGDISAEELAEFESMRTGEASGGRDGGEDDGAGEAHDAGEGDGEADDAGDDGVGDDGAGDREPGGESEGDGDAGTERQPESGQPRRKPKTISYGRFEREQAESARRLKEAQDAIQRERDERIKVDERVRLLSEAFQAQRNAPPAAAAPAAAATPPVDEDPEPNADEDIIGHQAWQIRKLTKTVDSLVGGQRDRDERAAQMSEEQRLTNDYVGDIERAAQADPAYGEAFVHLRESRYRELGYIYAGIDVFDKDQVAKLSVDDQQRLNQAIQNSFSSEQLMVAQEARRSGRRASEVVMNLARARGYQAKAATPPAAAAPPAAPAPAPRGKAPAARQAPRSVGEEISAIRDGMAASRSLSDAGGSPGGGLDLSRLADMSDAEFEEAYAEITGNSRANAAFERAMGKVPL